MPKNSHEKGSFLLLTQFLLRNAVSLKRAPRIVIGVPGKTNKIKLKNNIQRQYNFYIHVDLRQIQNVIHKYLPKIPGYVIPLATLMEMLNGTKNVLFGMTNLATNLATK